MKLTVKETADHFGVTPQTVYIWLKQGLEKSYIKKIGVRPTMVIDPEDVKKFHENIAEEKSRS